MISQASPATNYQVVIDMGSPREPGQKCSQWPHNRVGSVQSSVLEQLPAKTRKRLARYFNHLLPNEQELFVSFSCCGSLIIVFQSEPGSLHSTDYRMESSVHCWLAKLLLFTTTVTMAQVRCVLYKTTKCNKRQKQTRKDNKHRGKDKGTKFLKRQICPLPQSCSGQTCVLQIFQWHVTVKALLNALA